MLSNPRRLFYLMVYVISIIVGFGENPIGCIPNKLIYLSHCSFHFPQSSNLTFDNRTLSMTVPYSLDADEDENLSIKVLTRHRLDKSLIHFNLNLIQCFTDQYLRWTSVESSSTLRGEFVRTTLTNSSIMYLSSGLTYLRNLTMIDCSTKTMYRTKMSELFEINLKIESTLNDFCSEDRLCYPLNLYTCDFEQQHCICRTPFQSYQTKDHHSICVHAVENLTECSHYDNVRCLEWCQTNNSSSNMCLCPKDVTKKKSLLDDRIYCEGESNGICNSIIQCPFGELCQHGFCRNLGDDYSLERFLSFDLLSISISISSIILLGIILLLSISLCILRRRQRWKKRSHSSIPPVGKKKQEINLPMTSDYDNVVYGVFHHQVQSPLNEENYKNQTSYHPKIVFLGGDEQLTAIYA